MKGKQGFRRIIAFICAVLMISTVFWEFKIPVKAALVQTGSAINYGKYFTGSTWQTHYYSIDGNLAYCIQSYKPPVTGNSEIGTILLTYDNYPLLNKVLCYGYGGPAPYIIAFYKEKYGITLSDEQAYLYTHICANYANPANSGANEWYGITEQQAKDAHLVDWIRWCNDNVINGLHLTGGWCKCATPGDAQWVAYLEGYTLEPINVGFDVTLNFNKTKNTVGDATTQNAVYGLFNASGSLLKKTTLTIPAGSTTASGSFKSTISTSGTYYIQEITAPPGYLLDTTKYYFTADVSSKSVSSTDLHFTLENATTITFNKTDEVPIKGNFTFTKTDINDAPLQGTEFDVYLKSTLPVVGGVYDYEHATPACARLVSDANGEVTSPELEYGTYIVHEVTMPYGYSPIPDFEVDINSNGVTNILGKKIDPYVQGGFSLTKKGDDGIPIAGAGFSAYKSSEVTFNSAGEYDFSAATPVPIAPGGGVVLYTDSNGDATSELMDYGTYIVKEVVVPIGYEECDPFEVEISGDLSDDKTIILLGEKIDDVIPAKLKIIKKDSETGKTVLLSGASFKIYRVDTGTYMSMNGTDIFTTDDTGTVTTPLALPLGEYRVEEFSAPANYYLNGSNVSFVFDSTYPFTMNGTDKIIEIEFSDAPKKGKFELTKTGKGLTGFNNNSFEWTDVPLQNAEYEVRANEDIYSPDNQNTLLYSKDDLVGTLVTDASGKASIDDLYIGKYYIVEKTAPSGYILDTSHIEFEIIYNDSSTTPIISTKPVSDERQKIILDLKKTDKETGRPLAGAEFGIYAMEDIFAVDGTKLVSNGDLVTTAISDSNGVINFAIELPFNKFKIKEINAPANYVLDVTEFDINPTYPASTIPTITFTSSWENTPVKGYLEITKKGEVLTDYKDGKFIYEEKELPGAKFNVYAKEDIYTFDNAVDSSGNRYTYYKKDEFIEEITTDANGFAKTSNLPVGKYYLKETQAPYGMYLEPNPIDFTIDYKDQFTELTLSKKGIVNERQKVSLKVSKVASGWGYKLSGGQFKLINTSDIFDYKGNVLVPANTELGSVAAKNGLIDFGLDLPFAKYKVIETSAPNDYEKNSTEYNLDIAYTDPTIKVLTCDFTIYNKRVPHFAKVTMVLGATKTKGGRNNYVTEDNGEDGYSILLVSDGSIPSQEEMFNTGFALFIGASIWLLAGITIAVYSIRKKHRAKIRKDE